MNWHARYTQQAAWTEELRRYIFERCGLARARRVLEVGCGTGAVLAGLAPLAGASADLSLCGLDISAANLADCRAHAPSARLTRADARRIPFERGAFDIAFCHFLLLWVHEPVQVLLEMKRVTAPGGYVIAFAEPDYGARSDEPAELKWLGQQQNAGLERQGAALRRGLELASLLQLAGIPLTETGTIRPAQRPIQDEKEWENEWQVLEDDLAGAVPAEDLARIREVDRQARLLGQHVLHVPTYFAWGQV